MSVSGWLLTEEFMSDGYYGVIQFMPPESFQGRSARNELLKQEILQMLTNTPQRPQSVGDWPKVNETLLRGDMFVIETSTPVLSAMLHFCPERPDAGDYEVRYRLRGLVEKGRTTSVRTVDAEKATGLYSVLAPFPHRYHITTERNDRARTALWWLVGLNSYRTADETKQEDDAES